MRTKRFVVSLFLLAVCALNAAEVVKDSFYGVMDRRFKPEDAEKVSVTGKIPGNPVKFSVADDISFDLSKVFKNTVPVEERAIFTFKINSEKDQERYMWLWADYWYTCYINGKFVASTEPAGEMALEDDTYRTPRKIFLKKGENIVAVHTRRGTASWKLICRLLPERKDWEAKIIGPIVSHCFLCDISKGGERDSGIIGFSCFTVVQEHHDVFGFENTASDCVLPAFGTDQKNSGSFCGNEDTSLFECRPVFAEVADVSEVRFGTMYETCIESGSLHIGLELGDSVKVLLFRDKTCVHDFTP